MRLVSASNRTFEVLKVPKSSLPGYPRPSSNRTFEVLKVQANAADRAGLDASNRTFEVLKGALSALFSALKGLLIAPLRY